MYQLTVGMLAHVDAGKTTTSEAILYKSGKLKTLGRVDHKDAFLDNFLIEKQRGITVFSKQAVFNVGEFEIDLLDTPGHIDFSSEMERTLSVLDYAILVISAPDGVQAHTLTLWALLKKYNIPFFVWINKTDISVRNKDDILSDLSLHFGSGFVDFNSLNYEKIAELDEAALDSYLENGSVSPGDIKRMISERKLFPCYFGSALKLTGIDELLSGISSFAVPPAYCSGLKARVFKITRAADGKRLTWLKMLGGTMAVKDVICGEKINQIRKYSGFKFECVNETEPGGIYAVCGLENTYAGQGLGGIKDFDNPRLEPVLSYRIIPPDGIDSITAMKKLAQLNEEDPLLQIVYNPDLKQIEARLMGEVQIEILKDLISDRFGMDIQVDKGRIVYKETVAAPVIGMGHFEPLRHYAEVHLLIEPLPCGSGIEFTSALSTDILDLNWQRLILANLAEKRHYGVLTGSPLTDVKITLIAGRAHLKHTEGGDFRQAACRAVRNGLMNAKNILLEPYYDFILEVPQSDIGRGISDLKQMSCSFNSPEDIGTAVRLSGRGPVSELQNYNITLLSYTKGKGRLSLKFAGHFPCHNTEAVIKESGYDAERDIENTADSVFCSHGAGVNVKWDKVSDFVHLDSGVVVEDDDVKLAGTVRVKSKNMDFDEKELEAIISREFGEIKKPVFESVKTDFGSYKKRAVPGVKKNYIIVDGYNIIFAWEALKKLPVSEARSRLIEMLVNYRAYTECEICLVFDGYKLKGNSGTREDIAGVSVAYTKEGESADAFIEALVHDIGKNYSVKVATSDNLIQLAALRAGVVRMSAKELEYEVACVLDKISVLVRRSLFKKINLGDIIKINEK